MCLIWCIVLSSVSTTLGCSGFYKLESHSSWFVRWLEDPKSTYNTSSCIEVHTPIWLALCFMANVGPVSACPEPSMWCNLCHLLESALLDPVLFESACFFNHSLSCGLSSHNTINLWLSLAASSTTLTPLAREGFIASDSAQIDRHYCGPIRLCV